MPDNSEYINIEAAEDISEFKDRYYSDNAGKDSEASSIVGNTIDRLAKAGFSLRNHMLRVGVGAALRCIDYGIASIAKRIEERAKENAPVKTGNLKNSINVAHFVAGMSADLFIIANVPYAAAAEYATGTLYMQRALHSINDSDMEEAAAKARNS